MVDNQVKPGDMEAGISGKSFEPLNGETARQMAHARDWKARDYDTSRDTDFEEDKSLACTDAYVKITMGIFLVFKVVIFYVPLYLLQLPVVLCSRIYVGMCPTPTEGVERTCGFWVFTTLCFIFQLPTFVLVVVSFLVDCGFYYVFSIPWCILRCGLKKYFENQRKIAHYRGGPSILMHAPDVLVTIMGQTLRHGSFEVTHFITVMWCVMPTLKYYVNCNPFIYDLDERFSLVCSHNTSTFVIAYVALQITHMYASDMCFGTPQSNHYVESEQLLTRTTSYADFDVDAGHAGGGGQGYGPQYYLKMQTNRKPRSSSR
eukprot:7022902-Pyramimonas_sp.AAC.1